MHREPRLRRVRGGHLGDCGFRGELERVGLEELLHAGVALREPRHARRFPDHLAPAFMLVAVPVHRVRARARPEWVEAYEPPDFITPHIVPSGVVPEDVAREQYN